MIHSIKIRQLSSLAGKKIDNENVIYIGRENHHLLGSVLENTYPVKVYGRRKSLFLYSVWIREAIKARREEFQELMRLLRLAQQHEITLACYCVDSDDPNDAIYCHGQIIRKVLIEMDKRGF